MADENDVAGLFGNFNYPRLNPPKNFYGPEQDRIGDFRPIGDLVLRVLDRLSVEEDGAET